MAARIECSRAKVKSQITFSSIKPSLEGQFKCRCGDKIVSAGNKCSREHFECIDEWIDAMRRTNKGKQIALKSFFGDQVVKRKKKMGPHVKAKHVIQNHAYKNESVLLTETKNNHRKKNPNQKKDKTITVF